jgi:hypothetical protein
MIPPISVPVLDSEMRQVAHTPKKESEKRDCSESVESDSPKTKTKTQKKQKWWVLV